MAERWARAQGDRIAQKVAPFFETLRRARHARGPASAPGRLARGRVAAPRRTLVGTGWTITFTAPWNITGQPAASVPAG